MNRRDFLRTGAACAGLTLANRLWADVEVRSDVVTVTGPVAARQLGTTLPHEHVLVDFIGADQVSRDRYDVDEVMPVVLPHLQRLRELGCRTLVECTPAYLGRDPRLLKRLTESSGLQILTNTGYYGAGKGKFLPAHAHQESADQLAARWLAEWRDGIDGTGIRPGFIKIGMDGGPLTDVNLKLIQAAAKTHKESGLTIAAHTGDGTAALEQIQVLKAEDVSPEAWIWVHAQNEKNTDIHVEAAKQGAWVEFDGMSPDSLDRHVELVQNMQRHGLLQRVLISHDAGWYAVGEPGGGKFRPYDTLFTEFLPRLRAQGFSDDEVTQLTVANPAAAFGVRVRS
jgi:phosphotriesterase-related protein